MKPPKPQPQSNCNSYSSNLFPLTSRSPIQPSQILHNKTELQRHYLFSSLPHEYKKYSSQQQHFKKSYNFYKPEECIWNNVNRTSKKMYEYYHKGMDEYKEKKEKVVKRQEEMDRHHKRLTQILLLSERRNETRLRFYSKKIQRVNLQKKILLLMNKRRLSTGDGQEDDELRVLQTKRDNCYKIMNNLAQKFCAHSAKVKTFPDILNLTKTDGQQQKGKQQKQQKQQRRRLKTKQRSLYRQSSQFSQYNNNNNNNNEHEYLHNLSKLSTFDNNNVILNSNSTNNSSNNLIKKGKIALKNKNKIKNKNADKNKENGYGGGRHNAREGKSEKNRQKVVGFVEMGDEDE